MRFSISGYSVSASFLTDSLIPYFELVNSIQSSTNRADSIPASVSKANFNLFVIPAKSISGRATPNPHFELSKLLLTALSTSAPLSFSRPGPYIITLYQPISFGQQGDTADIFYVDLTSIHPAAIPEILHTYKSHVLDERLNGVQKLQSFRLSLLNAALIAEESIGFAKIAYAELQNAFSE